MSSDHQRCPEELLYPLDQEIAASVIAMICLICPLGFGLGLQASMMHTSISCKELE